MDSVRPNSSPLTTIVMRTTGGRPREIRRAVASVAANTRRPLELVVVFQGPEGDDWEDIQRLPFEFAPLPVRVLRNGHVGDRRAENLNIGWEAGRGRYIGFLDDDDTLQPQHLQMLVQAMETSGRIWAYSQVVLRKEDEALAVVSESRPFRRHRFSFRDLWQENFLPVHSLLIDRERLAPALRIRPFCEDLDRSEDWDFLLRLAFHHEPAAVDEFTCTYHVSTGSRNTNLSLMDNAGAADREQRNSEAWARCKALVEQRKAALLAPLWWAPGCLGLAAGQSAVQGDDSEPRRGLRQRVVRRLILALERLL